MFQIAGKRSHKKKPSYGKHHCVFSLFPKSKKKKERKKDGKKKSMMSWGGKKSRRGSKKSKSKMGGAPRWM